MTTLTNISQLPLALTLGGTEQIPIVQGLNSTAETKRTSPDLIGSGIFPPPVTSAIEVTMGAPGFDIETGTTSTLPVPFPCSIVAAEILGDETGSATVDIRLCTYTDYAPPGTPSASNSITGGNPLTLTVANHARSDLVGWTTDLGQTGDDNVLAFVVTGVPDIETVTVSLLVQRNPTI